MENILIHILYLSFGIHVGLMFVALWRVCRGENMVDRLMGFELLGTLVLAVLVLLSLISRRIIYIDVALGIAALSFIGTIALAKYVADEHMF